MTRPPINVRTYPSAEAVAQALAAHLLAQAAAAIERRGRYSIALAGGSTPRRLYERLAAAGADWPRWVIYFGDERCLPRGDAERNDTMARRAWLDHVPIPAGNIHFIPAELGPDEAARVYAATLAAETCLDTSLLGLGEDGHTASLFAGDPAGLGPSSPDAIGVHDAPKPPPERVSLSAQRLKRAREVLIVTAGAAKREAVGQLLVGDVATPAVHVVPAHGLELWLDEAARPAGQTQP